VSKLTIAQRAWMIAVVGLVAVEAYCAATGKQLLSEALWDCEGVAPIVPFAMGVFCGHIVAAPARFMKEIEHGS